MLSLMNLQDIYVYPIKSSAGINLSTSWVDNIGLPFDRRFVVSDEKGRFVTARTDPRLCLIQCNLTATGLILTAPDMPILQIDYDKCLEHYQPISIWNDSLEGQCCLPHIDQWFTQYLAKPSKLLYFGEKSTRKVVKTDNPVAFADGYPLLLISQASLDDLNKRLKFPVSMSQFRPNLVVHNCAPFEEDKWQHIRIGEVEFEVTKPCSRCIFTTVDPTTGEKHPQQEPLTTLKSYRQVEGGDVMFGQNLIPLNKGQIKRGDTVTIIKQGASPVFESKKTIKPVHKVSTGETSTSEVKMAKSKVNILFDSWNKQVEGNTRETILEQGESAGMILPYSCRGGMCGRCKIKLESGEVRQLADDGLREGEKEQGYILACSSVPKTDVVLTKP